MDLFPHARRVLLTAYADTDAAIQAINVVDLDHYLLKPWDPPEEKLYPVVDELIELWRTAGGQAGHRDPGRRPPLVGALLRGAGLPGPQLGAVPLAQRRRARGPAAAGGGRARRDQHPAGGDARGRRRWSTRASRSWRPGSACRPPRPPTSTTSSSSAAARPGWARPCTAPPRGCARSWSSGGPPAARPGRARGSRTTSASPTACRGAQLTERARRQASKFGAEILDRGDVVGLEVRGSARVVALRRRRRGRRPHRGPGHRRRLPQAGGARRRAS